MRVPSFGILGLGIIFAAPATAQTLAAGKWTGKLEISSGPTIEIEFTVQGEGDSLQIVMNAVNGPPSSVTGIEISKDRISFTWTAFSCSLKRKGNSKYEGECGGPADAQLSLESPSGSSSSSPDALTGERLVDTRLLTVYDALRQLRPQWLRGIGVEGAPGYYPVQIYLGRQLMGTVDFLRTIDPQTVAGVRFFSSFQRMPGRDNLGGAIVITER